MWSETSSITRRSCPRRRYAIERPSMSTARSAAAGAGASDGLALTLDEHGRAHGTCDDRREDDADDEDHVHDGVPEHGEHEHGDHDQREREQGVDDAHHDVVDEATVVARDEADDG